MKLRFHDLRHVFASVVLQLGGDSALKFVQKNLGHKKASFTLNVYSHLLPDRADVFLPPINALFHAGPTITDHPDGTGGGQIGTSTAITGDERIASYTPVYHSVRLRLSGTARRCKYLLGTVAKCPLRLTRSSAAYRLCVHRTARSDTIQPRPLLVSYRGTLRPAELSSSTESPLPQPAPACLPTGEVFPHRTSTTLERRSRREGSLRPQTLRVSAPDPHP